MKRRVFVTGGAHGIGKGIVKAFARQGDEVVFCDLDPVLGAQTAAGTGALHAGKPHPRFFLGKGA